MQKIVVSFSILLSISFGIFQSATAQSSKQDYLNTITTAVPFLTITPDARAGGMGDCGVATSPDANATYWNSAKLAFNKNPMGASLSYNPWLRKLVNDMALSYLSGYIKPRKEDAIAVSFKYFDLGQVQFTDNSGQVIRDFTPNEFAIGTYYSRMLSKSFSIGLGLKFFRSDLAGNYVSNSGTISKAINSVSADIGVYYTKDILVGGRNSNIAFGANISDIGPKVTYTTVDNKDFIPTNLRLGSTFTTEADAYNKFSFSFDINKLLVPSPQYDTLGNRIISDKGVVAGMISSFGDAPGGFKEEMQEYILCMAGEYWYNDIFAIRAGYHYENPNKGNRRYVTLGLGIRYNVFGLDMAYLIPIQQSNPLAETLRFSLLFNFAAKKAQESVQE